MSVYRFRDPSPLFSNLLGTASAPGGKWYFYDLGTTTPKDTYQDFDKTTPNANPIELDASGRFDDPVWLDGDYTVKLEAADGSTIIPPTEMRAEVAPGLAIPPLTGNGGKFLTNDGSTLSWLEIAQNLLPDPTGSSGMMPVVNSDGSGYILQNQPEPPEPPDTNMTITPTRITFRDDDDNKWQIIRGTATTTTGIGTLQAQGAVTYSTPFSESVAPIVTPTGGPFSPGNGYSAFYGDLSVTSYNQSGFTFIVNTNHADPGPASSEEITGNITVGFIAVGPIA